MRLCASGQCSAENARTRVPAFPGYYAIFVDEPGAIPEPFGGELARRGTRIIYIGIATKSLHSRLVEQDLQHLGPSTFFRAIGSILGFRPQPGSLIGRANQRNYRFGAEDSAGIINWINKHLLVNWTEVSPALKTTERALILTHRPLLNTNHNPDKLPALAALRHECRRIARNP